MIVRHPVTDEYLGIACDVCRTMAPIATEIQAAHGLTRLGWTCDGGVHLCVRHASANVEELRR